MVSAIHLLSENLAVVYTVARSLEMYAFRIDTRVIPELAHSGPALLGWHVQH